MDTVDENGVIARSYADAPEIDGVVYIEPDFSIKPGDWVDVRITRTGIHDLWAKNLTHIESDRILILYQSERVICGSV